MQKVIFLLHELMHSKQKIYSICTCTFLTGRCGTQKQDDICFRYAEQQNSFEVFSFRKWVHHVHNCWLRSHIEFWILKPTSLDLQLMTFGSKTLMLGSKNRSFWDAKSMILGSKIDLGASWGDLWPILAPRAPQN